LTSICQLPRAPPKIFQLLIKTHKLTVFLTFPNTTLISTVKEDVLSALQADVAQGLEVPILSGTDDFELSHEVKEKNRRQGASRFQVLLPDQVLKNVVNNWEVLFVRFKTESGRSNIVSAHRMASLGPNPAH
jgi:hypothetical protein